MPFKHHRFQAFSEEEKRVLRGALERQEIRASAEGKKLARRLKEELLTGTELNIRKRNAEKLMSTADGVTYYADSHGNVIIESHDGENSLSLYADDLHDAWKLQKQKMTKDAL